MGISNNPAISIIVPVYNSESVLEQCLSSILEQSFRDFELVLIDDGSTDSSGSICDRFAEADERVKVYHITNSGVSKARNKGMAVANGEWVTFVDHDDMLPAGALSTFSVLIDREDIDIIQGRVFKLREGQEIPTEFVSRVSEDIEILDIYEFSNRGGTCRTNVWGKLYRNEHLKTCRFPADHFCEDIYFNGLFFSSKYVKKAAVINSYTYIYRVNDNSSSHKWGVLDFYDMCKVMAVLYEKVRRRTNSAMLISEYLQLFFTQYFSFRYNIILRRGYKGEIKKKLLVLKRKYMKELLSDSIISVRKKVVLVVMAQMNAVYRSWVIVHDPTMKTYEKIIRESMKK